MPRRILSYSSLFSGDSLAKSLIYSGNESPSSFIRDRKSLPVSSNTCWAVGRRCRIVSTDVWR